MKTILLSAFKAFGDYPTNPTEIIANQLAGCIFSGFRVSATTFEANIPTENRGKIILEIARDINATAIVSMGMDSSKRGLCVENTAVNRVLNEKYCLRSQNNTPVDTSRPYGERLTIDLSRWDIVSFLRTCRSRKIPVMEISENAGAFCCNHLIYQVCVEQLAWHDQLRVPFIFVHTPCSPEAVPNRNSFAEAGKVTITVAEIMRGLAVLLEHSLIAAPTKT